MCWIILASLCGGSSMKRQPVSNFYQDRRGVKVRSIKWKFFNVCMFSLHTAITGREFLQQPFSAALIISRVCRSAEEVQGSWGCPVHRQRSLHDCSAHGFGWYSQQLFVLETWCVTSPTSVSCCFLLFSYSLWSFCLLPLISAVYQKLFTRNKKLDAH